MSVKESTETKQALSLYPQELQQEGYTAQALPSPAREQAQRAVRCEWSECGRGFPEEGTLST